MREQLTYAQLVKKQGRSVIIKDPPKIFVAGLICIAHDLPKNPCHSVESTLIAGKTTSTNVLSFGFILTSAGANGNDQFFVEDEICIPDVYNSVIGQPINEDHEQSFHAIVGNITQSSFLEASEAMPSSIYCGGEIYSDIYPDVAKKVQRGAGRWAAVSMEAIPNPLEMVGKYLVIHMPKFVGAGLVRFPANEYSQIDEVDGQHIQDTYAEVARLTNPFRLAVRSLFF